MKKIKFFIAILIFSFMFSSVVIAQGQKQGNQNSTNNITSQQDQIQQQNRTQIQEQERVHQNVGKTTTGTQQVNMKKNSTLNFAQNLLQVANTENVETGKQLKIIAQEQNQIKNNIDERVKKIRGRNKIQTFLFGSDYKNLGQLRSEMVKVRNQIQKLQNTSEEVKNEDNRQILQQQIQTLEQEQTQINNFIKTNEGKFSLFGWFTKLFNK